MTGTLTPTGQAMMLDWMFVPGSSPARPTVFYLSLHTGASSNGTANEVSTSGTGYSRVASTWTRSGNVISNATALSIGPFTSAIGTVTDCCVWTAVTGGVCIAQGVDTASVTYGINDTATIAIGAQTLALT